jgi:O-antigen/teichoic acid export membrane protein
MNILDKKLIFKFINLIGSVLLAKMISFITAIIIARTLSVYDYGIYKWYSTIIGYFILLINFGFDVYFYKLIIHKKFSIEKVLAIQLKSRLFFGTTIYLLVILIGSYFIKDSNNKLLFFILALQILIYAINTEIILKIKEYFSFLSLYTIFQAIFTLLLVIMFIRHYEDVIKLALIIVLVNLISNVICGLYIKNKTNFNISKFVNLFKKLKFKYVYAHLKKSIIVNLSFFMISIYYNLDSLMLGIFRTNIEVAIYSVAYVFLLLAIMPTNILYTVYSPTLSENNYKKRIFYKYVLSTVFLGIIVFVFLLLTYKYLILISYGEKYLSSVNVLFYLSFDIIPCYLAGAFANPINLWGDYKNYLFIVSIGAISNFVGNLIFIPVYGINGAIFTTILSEILVFIFAFLYWIKNKELLK